MNKELVNRGHEVTVVTTNMDAGSVMAVPVGEPVIKDGVRIFYFPVRSPRSWYFSPAAREFLKKHMAEYDIVHITSVFLYFSYIGAKVARRIGKPYIISPRGSLMHGPLTLKGALKKRLYIRFIERDVLSGAAALHFTALAEKEEYLKAGLPPRPALLVPNALDTAVIDALDPTPAFRKKFRIPEEKKIILFLGRLNWKKGLDTLIPAFAGVLEREPQAFLLIAGSDDGYKKQAEKLWESVIRKSDPARRSDLQNILDGKARRSDLRPGPIRFVGLLLGGDKKAALEESEVFVLPSYSENFGMAVVEAMYAELPVVITPQVGLAPEVAEAGAGLVVQKDKDLLAQALIDILAGKQNGREMGQNGRRLVSEQFTLEATGQAMEAAYMRLIGHQ